MWISLPSCTQLSYHVAKKTKTYFHDKVLHEEKQKLVHKHVLSLCAMKERTEIQKRDEMFKCPPFKRPSKSNESRALIANGKTALNILHM